MKRLKRNLLSCLLAAGLCALPVSSGGAASIASLAADRLCIVGSIANKQELKLTLAYLEQLGVEGAFVISATEARLYPDRVRMITQSGHMIILDMDSSSKESSSAAVPAPKKQPVSQPETPKSAPPAAAPVQQPVIKETKEQPVPKTEADTPKPAKKSVQETDDEAAEKNTVQGAPFVMEHSPQNSPSFRERAAREKKRQAELAGKPVPKEPSIKLGVNDALKVVGKQEEKPVKVSRPLTKRQRLARDFYGVDEHGNKVGLRYPGTAKPESEVPDWSIKSLVKLSDYGLASPDDVREIQSAPDRELMAKLTARAYNMYNEGYASKNEYDARFELEKLMREYDTELRNLGYDAGRYAVYGGLPKDLSTKVGGELRYHYVDHEGDPVRNEGDHSYDFYDSRLRLRLYVEHPLDENWKLYGMGEANKSWSNNSVRNFSLERLYISGRYKELQLTGGRFGSFYADGNVYDGRFDGLRVAGGKKVKVAGELGEFRDGQKGGAVIASYSEDRYDLEAGIYNFDNVKSYGNTTIGSLGGMYYIGNFGFGAMYLYSSADSPYGGSDGYVVTVKYGRNRSWVPGTYEIFAKYYNQSDSTYVAHTMVGLADYMRGFRGFGAGMYYTLAENIVYGIEYYDLKDKAGGRKGRTLWNHVSLFF